MSGVDIPENPGGRIEGGVEQCGVAFFKAGFMELLIHRRNDFGKIRWRATRFGSQGCFKICRKQGGSDTFARHVADGEAEIAVWQTQKIVEIAAHRVRLPAFGAAIGLSDPRGMARQQMLLDGMSAAKIFVPFATGNCYGCC
jgi:hypothetical protein